MKNEDLIANFDPNGAGSGDNIYGLPFTAEEASLIILPVPWEVTVSYSAGTAGAPQAIFDASFQVDLYDPNVKDAWKLGIAMDSIDNELHDRSSTLRELAEEYISMFVEGVKPEESPRMMEIRQQIEDAGLVMNHQVKTKALHFIDSGKKVAVLGGDHSTPLGLIEALAERNSEFAILQIDAHADLRIAYEGFEFSHASIMYNALKIPQVKQLVQVGIRDYCESELDLINASPNITTFFDHDMKRQMFEGKNWASITEDIINKLPEKVYISIDIDGLDPRFCPNTGTPVPGGMEYDQVLYLIEKLVRSKRSIIGFDLNEVAPGDDEWDANVAARLLYRVANLALVSGK
jgi:agmatinase